MKFIFLLALIQYGCASSISGKLVDSRGQAVVSKDARVNVVSLEPKGNFKNEVLRVDEKGRFATSTKLPKGKYLVEALVPGYGISSVRVELEERKRLLIKLSSGGKLERAAFKTNDAVDSVRGQGGANLTPPKL